MYNVGRKGGIAMLGANIRILRQEKGLSQEELAAEVNVVRQTVSKWEKGLSVPDAAALIHIAKALDTTVDILLGEPLSEEQETVASLSKKLEKLNETLAKREESNRKLWRWIFAAVLFLAVVALAKEVLEAVYLYQTIAQLQWAESVIGGADGPTAVLVAVSGKSVLPLVWLAAAVAAAVGLWRTKRR